MKSRSKKHPQLTLDDARKPSGRGGWRPNAGRKRDRKTVAHGPRAPFSKHHPQFVTLRIVVGVPSLRRYYPWRAIVDSIAESQRAEFRIIEFNVLSNHLHLLIEASTAGALAAGMQGLEVRIARKINKLYERTGRLFESRYHSRTLATPREVRNVLCYILRNQAHHTNSRCYGIDAYSSGAWFDGWKYPFTPREPWQRQLAAMTPPTVRPSVWLLTTGWKRHGLIGYDEIPGVTGNRSSAGHRIQPATAPRTAGTSRTAVEPARHEPHLPTRVRPSPESDTQLALWL